MKKNIEKFKKGFNSFMANVKTKAQNITTKFIRFIILNVHTLFLLIGLGAIILAVFLLHYIAGIFAAGVTFVFIGFLLSKGGQ